METYTAISALCPDCHRHVPSYYQRRGSQVVLHRCCPNHGPFDAVVSSDVSYFDQCVEKHSHRSRSRPGLIVELLDGCNIQCATCIASSSPALHNLRRPADLAAGLVRAARDSDCCALLLSGGEPTIHPDFLGFIELSETLPDIEHRIVISNGIRFADDQRFVGEFAQSMQRSWQVFLQFDSLNAAVLEDIRGQDLRETRLQALRRLADVGIPSTLICVVKRGVNLTEVGPLIEFAMNQPFVVGIQFQPIRNAGRIGNYNAADNSCDLALTRKAILEAGVVPDLLPHPMSPLSVSVARFDRRNETWNECVRDDEYFYLQSNQSAQEQFQVSIVEYSDVTNWSTAKSVSSPLRMMSEGGASDGVDDYFVNGGPLEQESNEHTPADARAAN